MAARFREVRRLTWGLTACNWQTCHLKPDQWPPCPWSIQWIHKHPMSTDKHMLVGHIMHWSYDDFSRRVIPRQREDMHGDFDIKRQEKADYPWTFEKLGGTAHRFPGWPLHFSFVGSAATVLFIHIFKEPQEKRLCSNCVPSPGSVRAPRAGSIRGAWCGRTGGSCRLVCDTLSSHISLLGGPPKPFPT